MSSTHKAVASRGVETAFLSADGCAVNLGATSPDHHRDRHYRLCRGYAVVGAASVFLSTGQNVMFLIASSAIATAVHEPCLYFDKISQNKFAFDLSLSDWQLQVFVCRWQG